MCIKPLKNKVYVNVLHAFCKPSNHGIGGNWAYVRCHQTRQQQATDNTSERDT